jgi:hypothetical protein
MAGKAYPALVSPVTDGAWVGVVGVAIGGVIAIAGTAVNGRIALRTTKTTIEGEERQRLWEKRCAAYEETVREVLARQTRREALTSRGDPVAWCLNSQDHRAIGGPLDPVTRGLPRSTADSQTSRSGPLAACFCQLPKLIVRVRFSSPAPRRNPRS